MYDVHGRNMNFNAFNHSFLYTCGISECTRRYNNLQNMYFRQYDRDSTLNKNEEDLNIMPEPVRRFEGGNSGIMKEQGTVRE